MRIRLLALQRVCSYPGEHVPEVLAVVDERLMSEDPGLWEAQVSGIKYDVGEEAAAWAEVEVELDDQELEATLTSTSVSDCFVGEVSSRVMRDKRPC